MKKVTKIGVKYEQQARPSRVVQETKFPKVNKIHLNPTKREIKKHIKDVLNSGSGGGICNKQSVICSKKCGGNKRHKEN